MILNRLQCTIYFLGQVSLVEFWW